MCLERQKALWGIHFPPLPDDPVLVPTHAQQHRRLQFRLASCECCKLLVSRSPTLFLVLYYHLPKTVNNFGTEFHIFMVHVLKSRSSLLLRIIINLSNLMCSLMSLTWILCRWLNTLDKEVCLHNRMISHSSEKMYI